MCGIVDPSLSLVLVWHVLGFMVGELDARGRKGDYVNGTAYIRSI